MPALAFNPVCPFGKRTVTSAGTPVLLFATNEVPVAAQNVWPTRVSRILLTALPGNTGLIYIGVKGMVVSTLVGVLAIIDKPTAATALGTGARLELDQLAFGANNYRLQDYWIDSAVNGEGVIRTVWIG